VEYEAECVVLGAANRVRQARHRAGGRGLAVARLLHRFGHDVVAAGLAGGSAGELIRNDLARAGVPTQFTRITAETRRQLSFAEHGPDRVTTFTEPAPYITTEELGRLAADYRALLDGATAVVLSGSLPDGLPEEIYASFVSYAAGAGVPVVLNAAGPALAYGAARQPALAVPEMTAAGDPGFGSGPPAAFPPDGPGSVALLAPTGVQILTPGGQWRARIGAAGADGGRGQSARRDALVAGFVPGIALGWSWPDILRHAVALGAAWSPLGELDVPAYEQALTGVDVEWVPGDHTQ
jgi:tagatose 6-phosphate kinase